MTRVTKGQAAGHQAVERLAREHPVLLAGLAEGRVLTKSVALQLAKWTRAIPGEYRDEAEEIVMTAALPLDVGQTDDIPVHLRRLVALRDQKCQHPGGCDQPAAGCEPHHVVNRKDGGTTSLANLKDYCWWHHHVVLHELGWQLTVHPDGTSQVRSPAGKTIRSHSPPPRPG